MKLNVGVLKAWNEASILPTHGRGEHVTHGTRSIGMALVVEMGVKATQKEKSTIILHAKSWLKNKTKQNKGDSRGDTFNQGVFQLVTPTHCKHGVRFVTFTKEALNLQLELGACPGL